MPDNFGASQLAALMGLIQQRLAAAQLGQPTGPADEMYMSTDQMMDRLNALRGRTRSPQAYNDPGIYKVSPPQGVDPQSMISPQGLGLNQRVFAAQRGQTDYPPMQLPSNMPTIQPPGTPIDPSVGDQRKVQNYMDASEKLALTPQEQNLYKHHLGNLYGQGKVIQPNGDISTVEQAVVTGPDSRYYSIPTVWNGREVDPGTARQLAAQAGWDKWPSYASPQEADDRYQRIHSYIDKDARDYRAMLLETP